MNNISTLELCDKILIYLSYYRDNMIPMYDEYVNEIKNLKYSVIFDYDEYANFVKVTSKYKNDKKYLEYLKLLKTLVIALKSDRYNMFSDILINFNDEQFFPHHGTTIINIKDKIPLYF